MWIEWPNALRSKETNNIWIARNKKNTRVRQNCISSCLFVDQYKLHGIMIRPMKFFFSNLNKCLRITLRTRSNDVLIIRPSTPSLESLLLLLASVELTAGECVTSDCSLYGSAVVVANSSFDAMLRSGIIQRIIEIFCIIFSNGW